MIRPGRESACLELSKSEQRAIWAAMKKASSVATSPARRWLYWRPRRWPRNRPHPTTTHSERFCSHIDSSLSRTDIEPGSTVHTDGWYGYLPLRTSAYQHRISNQKGHLETSFPSCCHASIRSFSLLKRWLLGTQNCDPVAGEHLQDYLNETFAFRFNRRKSCSRGKLFYRLAQQRPPFPQPNLQLTDNGCGLGHQTRE